MTRHYTTIRVYGEVKCNLPGEIHRLEANGWKIQQITNEGDGFWNPIYHNILAYYDDPGVDQCQT